MDRLGPAELFTAGAVGEPGARTFYLHVVAAGAPFWMVAEKAQVAALAERSLEIISEAGLEPDQAGVEDVLSRADLPEPGEIAFRAGTMALRASDARELVTVTITDAEEDDGIEFDVAPEQLQAMAVKGLEAVAAGRPTCDLCRLPMDTDGHRCPATNGHHTG